MEDGAHWRDEATTWQKHGWSVVVSLCFHGLCVGSWLVLQPVREPVPEPVFVWAVVMHQMVDTGFTRRDATAHEQAPYIASVGAMARQEATSYIEHHIPDKRLTHKPSADEAHGLTASSSVHTETAVGIVGTVHHPQILSDPLADQGGARNNELAVDDLRDALRLQARTDTSPQHDSEVKIGEFLSTDSVSLGAIASVLKGQDEEERKEAVSENGVRSDSPQGPPTDYGWLKTVVTAKIQETIQYPSLARERRWEGKVVVRCTITVDGEFKNLTVTESSGFEVLDVDAVALLRKISPLRLDQPLGQQEVSLIIPISYVIR